MLCSLALLPKNVSTRNVSLHSAAFNALAGFRDASPFHDTTSVAETDGQPPFQAKVDSPPSPPEKDRASGLDRRPLCQDRP